MIRARNAILSSVLLISLQGCGSSRSAEEQTKDFRSIAQERFKDKAEFLFNESRTHVLCLERSKPSTEFPLPRVSFFLFDITSAGIILEESLNGSVAWENNEHIRIDYVQGIVESTNSKTEQASSYLYNVRTRQRTPMAAENFQKTE